MNRQLLRVRCAPDAHLPLLGELQGVHHQVVEHLCAPMHVRVDDRQARLLDVVDELDLRPLHRPALLVCGVLKHMHRLLNHLHDVARRDVQLELLASHARDVHDVGHQVQQPRRAVGDHLELPLPHGVAFRKRERVAEAANAMDRRAQLVRYDRHEAHFPLLEGLVLGDVLPDADDADDGAGRVQPRCGAQEQHDDARLVPGGVPAVEAELEVRGLFAVQRVAEHSLGAVLRAALKEPVHDHGAENLGPVNAGDPAHLLVPLGDPQVLVHPEDRRVGRVDQPGELVGRPVGVFFRRSQVGDVLPYADHADDLPVRPAPRRGGHEDLDLPVQVLGEERELEVRGLLPAEGQLQHLRHALFVLRADEAVDQVFPERLLLGVLGDGGDHPVPLGHLALGVDAKDRRVGGLDDLRQVIGHPL
mmetsp:Transcript_25061/g.72263  ORF Transcript_25061/g.72263 Transcript_25061/m.72263 type:complete len:418 (+) Transcript_25061:994-2247(+)